ncbi:MAG: hypothetical protein FWG20_04950 [Candidatus Cloacimonetes bacterium]|nr:hypothetical protein [Candidatus Cloacimonadota bacterium]
MKKYLFILILILTFASLSASNLNTVENPTAALLNAGEARISQIIYKENGMMFCVDVGLFEAFQIGVGYGAEHLVGDKEPEWHEYPVVKARVRIVEETFTTPAMAVGVDTQGHGAYHKGTNRFDIKSKGAYFVLSKNYDMMGLIGFDAGANYTFENTKGDQDWDIFAGVYKTLGESFTLFADFSAGLNDTQGKDHKHDMISGRGRTYLNTAFQWNITDQFALKFLMHDLLKNKRTTELFDRSIVLDYRWFF